VHPGLKVQLTEASTPAQLAALRRGRMEVAIVATGEGLPEYDLEGLRLTALRSARGAGVAVAESHPFAVRERIEPEGGHRGAHAGPTTGLKHCPGGWAPMLHSTRVQQRVCTQAHHGNTSADY
jgi:DNA-binding transcriptional LysR family regulator